MQLSDNSMTSKASDQLANFKPRYGGSIERSALSAVFFLLLLLFLPVAAFFGMKVSDLPEDRQRLLDEMQERRVAWLASRPAHFQYQLRRECFCGEVMTRPFKIVEHDNTVRVLAIDDALVERLPDVASVGDLFDILETGIREADRVKVAFHEEYAFPPQISINWFANVTDNEDRYYVSNFEVVDHRSE